MPYKFEIRTKEGKLIVRSRTPIPTLNEAKLVGRLNLKDKRTPIGSKLKVFKINEKTLDPFKFFGN